MFYQPKNIQAMIS